MFSFLVGRSDGIHGPDDAVAYELAGTAAVYRNGYKLLKNNPPLVTKNGGCIASVRTLSKQMTCPCRNLRN